MAGESRLAVEHRGRDNAACGLEGGRRYPMRSLRVFALLTALVLLVSHTALPGEKKSKELTDQQFGRALTMFLEDPLQEKGKELAKLLVVFTMQTPKAAVILGEPEMKWIGKKDDDRSLLLFAAYVSGNTRSQLLSGVKQNDRYSGLVTLFAVYQRLQDKDKKYQIAEVDELRKLHRDGKLLAHLVEMEKKMPTKLSPDDEKALKELLKKKQ